MRPSVEKQMLASAAAGAAAMHEHHGDDGFWEGFGLPGCPPLLGMTVLDLGCGRGFRCFEAASHGAARVVGLDPGARAIEIAQTQLQAQPEPVRERVRFVHGRLEDLPPDQTYDVIISQDALEHVMDVPSLLAEAKRRLRPGGRMYIGFGPPYHAPWGDHSWLRAMLPGFRYFLWPWGHLLFERYAFRKLSQLHGRSITQSHDWPYLDLNRHTVTEFERMFRESGLRLRTLRRNRTRSLRGRVLTMVSNLPGLSRYLTLDIYAVLERSPAELQAPHDGSVQSRPAGLQHGEPPAGAPGVVHVTRIPTTGPAPD